MPDWLTQNEDLHGGSARDSFDPSEPDDPCPEPLECIDDYDGDCRGAIEPRMSLTGTGTAIPRCAKHWERRLDLEDQINTRYPVHPPSDWSPLDAGESWGEDDY